MNSEQQQLLKLIGELMNIYGAQGKYNKPEFIKSGKPIKHRVFTYPNQSELMQMWDDVKNNDYDSRLTFNRITKLKLESL